MDRNGSALAGIFVARTCGLNLLGIDEMGIEFAGMDGRGGGGGAGSTKRGNGSTFADGIAARACGLNLLRWINKMGIELARKNDCGGGGHWRSRLGNFHSGSDRGVFMVPALAGAVVVADTDLVEEVYIAVLFGFECDLHRSLGLGRCYG